MRFGRLFLAGDAAHIVPPTGAKGLNLAASDVGYLARALAEHYAEKSDAGIDAYSQTLPAPHLAGRALLVVVHVADAQVSGDRRVRPEDAAAELDYLVRSHAASTVLAENYVGLPLN